MKKSLLSVALSICSIVAFGQLTNLGSIQSNNCNSKSNELRGHTPTAYELMRYHANQPKHRVYESKSNVASDKAEVILEAHKVFGEFAKLGFQMLLDSDATAYGELFYDWSGAYYGTYDNFEYKIPGNADASDMSENIVYDDAISIEIPAGTYDFMILYPYPGDGLIITNGEYAKYDDFEFKGGNTYRFVVEYAENEDGWLTDMAFLYTDIDAAISSLNIPANSMDLTDSEEISIEIINRGTSAISNFTVSYQVNDNTAITENFTGTIEPGETATYHFTAKADLSVEQQYEIKAWITLEGDMISSNDSKTGKCKHIGVSQLPFTYDFSTGGVDGFTSDWTVENLNEDYSEWQYNEWTNGVDGTQGVASCGGAYGGDKTGNDNLISPPVYLPVGDIHMILYTKCINGTDATELLDVRYGTTPNVEEMKIIGDYAINQTEWVKRIINFNVAEAGTYYFAFHAKSIDGMNVFIDDITIDAGFFEVSPLLNIEKVVLPYSNCDLSDASKVGARIKNIGTGPTSTFTLTYTVNGKNKVVEEFTQVIQPTETATVYFNTTADFAEVGEYAVYVTASTGTEEESSLSNTINCYAPITTLPVTTNFITGENYNDYWTEMNEEAWKIDEFTGQFVTENTGLENGLLSHCFYLENSVRIKLQYSKGGWVDCRMYVAYGKSGTDLSTYTKVYENTLIEGDTEVEFIVPITDPDSYSFVIVNDSEENGNLYLYTYTISNLNQHDLKIEDATQSASAYTPQLQLTKEGEYYAQVVNRGTEQMTGVKIALYEGETLLGESTEDVVINSFEKATISLKALLPEKPVGSQINLTMKVTANEDDEFIEDNTFTFKTINVTENLYATENLEEIQQGIGEWGKELYVGNVYNITVADVLESVTLGFSPVSEMEETMAFEKIGFSIYSVNSDMTLDKLLIHKEFDRGYGGFSTIDIDPMMLNPGTYYFEVQQLSTYNMGLGYDSSDPTNCCYQNVDNILSKVSGLALSIRANFNSDLTVYEKDAAVVSFVAPVKESALFTDSETISIVVKNKGYSEADIPVRLSVNGTNYDTEITLGAYEEQQIDFTSIDMSEEGEYIMEAQTMLQGDEYVDNDKLTKTYTTLEESNPYKMDFESCYDFDASPDIFNPRWTTIDRNNAPTNYYWRYDHQYRGEPVGFIAFNPESTKPAVDPEDLPGFTPNSGKRFGAAFCLGYEAEQTISDVWLISPKLKLGENSSLELFVKTRYIETMDQDLEKYRLLISDTDNEFDSFVVLGEESRSAATEWEKVEVDLSEYDNKEVYVAIQYVGERLKNVCFMVDDIEVKTTSSIATTLSDKLSLSHANNNLTIKSNADITRFEIVNVQGQIVETAYNLGNGIINISTANYATGIYIAKAYTQSGSETIKFIVK